MLYRLNKLCRTLGQAARLMVGMPDYQAYLEHMRSQHPDKPPMSYEEFFRERQQARYGGSRPGRCC
jgi:uncharacterized short protein YbdD (DUF466 family)